ncbi:dipeptidase [Pseudalkalibacillus berkeleyi]|uniref:Dipeptidase n=1 Tax=Pseudalkalibacillus berkeleyi TaxID=1069813 RepID=A0ABS9GWW6_9BACL|nr:dipeptidase [Pseudalkalibacillus berkeleyi]MCF6137184.1 dipeptidase [Pseudalkalibacillus berkeleyi]
MVFDAHCDALLKMWRDPQLTLRSSNDLQVSYQGMKCVGSKVQCFAIFVPDDVVGDARFQAAIDMIHIFHEKVVKPYPDLKMVSSKEDILQLREHEVGVMLTLEGCGPVANDLTRLSTLIQLGVRSVGLTWNYANDLADGVLEERQSGLSNLGKQAVQLLHKEKVWTDVSHLTEAGFWDVLQHTNYVIASHSNVRALCNHPRNLNDQQIKALIKKNSVIGITFVPYFLSERSPVYMNEVIKHIDYVASMGGVNNIGFGSDFDGISETVRGLESIFGYESLINELLKHFSEDNVRGFCFNNFYNRICF